MSTGVGVTLGEAKVIRETEKALLVMFDEGDQMWIPKSVIHDNSEVYSEKNGEGTLVVETWWASKNGLEEG